MTDVTNSFVASAFESLINTPTRRTGVSATRIDHIYMNLRVECLSDVIVTFIVFFWNELPLAQKKSQSIDAVK